MEKPRVDFDKERAEITAFLETFSTSEADDESPTLKYVEKLTSVANRKERRIVIELGDIMDSGREPLVGNILSNTRRYISLFSEAIDSLLKDKIMPTEDLVTEDVFDVLLDQRMEQLRKGTISTDPSLAFPTELRRRYELTFRPDAKLKPVNIRQVRAVHIGNLVKVKGIVTRVGDVKPLCSVATYTCNQCGFEIYQEVMAKNFMPLVNCPSQRCKTNNINGQLIIQTRGSKFTKFQEIKLQESPEQVPVGHIPRTMTVHLRGELCRSCLAGDLINISGIYLPVPYTGFAAIKAGLLTNTFLEAQFIEQLKKSTQDNDDEEVQSKIDELQHDDSGRVYDRLAESIAPEIFGHEDVKKALLLQMVGGTTKIMADGMRIRGDLHVVLVGDPGVAKSQLLKHVASMAPRGVYTSGKGSSGVGLTAAIIRDQYTNDLFLEGGALVLADMGICCIDEFDKMDEYDRTAIHEVMEQQTVSIAKAGITTTLNARTAVLAAANPLHSRYTLKKSVEENVNLPPALLSRFDLIFLLLDTADMAKDIALAKHITHVHANLKAPEKGTHPIDPKIMRAYIARAKKYHPSIDADDVMNHIVETYVETRKKEADPTDGHATTTARSLLSIMRLAQALARLRFSEEVSRYDVDEANRLIRASRESVDNAMNKKNDETADDPVGALFHHIKEALIKTGKDTISHAEMVREALGRGFSEADVDHMVDVYDHLDILQKLEDGSVRLIDRPIG